MHYVSIVLTIAAVVIVAIFAIQNLQIVEVDFLFWSMKLSKFLVILVAYVMGMLTGWGVVAVVKRYMAA